MTEPSPPRVDRRGTIPRKLARIRKELSVDLEKPLSAADDALLRAAALAVFRVNELEAAMMRGDVADDGAIVPLLNAAHRLLASVSKRGRKSGAPDLAAYLRARNEKTCDDARGAD